MRAYFDIETGGLSPRKDGILVMSYATDEGEPLTHTNAAGESVLIINSTKSLDESSEIVSWNGWRFDVPFLNSRASRLGLSSWQHPLHVDLGAVTKARYGLRYWSQAAVMQHFGLEPNPYPYDARIWAYAKSGDPEALNHVRKHCEYDVTALRSLYGLLMLGDNHVE